jgi:hypothetical protein
MDDFGESFLDWFFFQIPHSISMIRLRNIQIRKKYDIKSASTTTDYIYSNHNMDPPLLSERQGGSICVTAVTAVFEAVEEHHRKRPKTDHRTLSRSQRQKFDHDDALNSTKRDYLGKRKELTTSLFDAEFTWMFRVSKCRLHVLMEDIMNSQHDFFKPSPQDGPGSKATA